MSLPLPTARVQRLSRCLIAALMLILLLPACSRGGAPASTPEPPATLEPTALPTATATPVPPDRVVLVGGPDTDPQVYPALEAALKDLAAQSSLEFQALPTLAAGQIGPETKVVVFVTPPADLAGLVSAAPQTQFVAASSVDLAQAPNLSVIRSRPEYLAFTAGFISVMTAADWRAGGMLPADGPLGGSLSDAYINGGHYFCGVCNSFYAPVIRFPVAASQPAAADLATWQGEAGQFANNVIYMVYVDPQIATPELLNSLAGQGFFLLGGKTPPAEVLPRWVVTIQPDFANPLRALWPDLTSGKGGQVVSAGVLFSDIQTGIFSTGKQDLAARMLTDLTADMIQVFSPPLE